MVEQVFVPLLLLMLRKSRSAINRENVDALHGDVEPFAIGGLVSFGAYSWESLSDSHCNSTIWCVIRAWDSHGGLVEKLPVSTVHGDLLGSEFCQSGFLEKNDMDAKSESILGGC